MVERIIKANLEKSAIQKHMNLAYLGSLSGSARDLSDNLIKPDEVD